MRAVGLALRLGLIVMALVILAGAACAEDSAPTPQAKTGAQAQAQATPTPGGAAAVSDRVSALEKQNTVLSEDIGKARLETRTRLEELAKRQAEQIEKLNQELERTRAEMKAEREKQQNRNRSLWIAVGVLALGVIASN